jgi:hypothetical protein
VSCIHCHLFAQASTHGVRDEHGQIEKSNLSRQFLFRNTDINRPKSTTAVRAVTAMIKNWAMMGISCGDSGSDAGACCSNLAIATCCLSVVYCLCAMRGTMKTITVQ